MPIFTVKRTETYYATIEAPSRKALDAAISGEDAQRHEWLHARLDKGYEEAHTTALATRDEQAARWANEWPADIKAAAVRKLEKEA